MARLLNKSGFYVILADILIINKTKCHKTASNYAIIALFAIGMSIDLSYINKIKKYVEIKLSI